MISVYPFLPGILYFDLWRDKAYSPHLSWLLLSIWIELKMRDSFQFASHCQHRTASYLKYQFWNIFSHTLHFHLLYSYIVYWRNSSFLAFQFRQTIACVYKNNPQCLVQQHWAINVRKIRLDFARNPLLLRINCRLFPHN